MSEGETGGREGARRDGKEKERRVCVCVMESVKVS